MNATILLFAALPVLSTFLGGLTVYYWKKDLHPWLSLSGGLLLGVAFLDLLPESLEAAQAAHLETGTIFGATLVAILIFHLIDKGFAFHSHHEHAHNEPSEHCENTHHRSAATWLRASGMVLHSILDGIAIGGGFSVDTQLGILVTLAVITHDFSDGMSTVTILKHGLGHTHRGIIPFLLMDAIAPFIGAFIGTTLAPSQSAIAILLSLFAGFFIFLSLSELLPQAHAGEKPHRFGLLLTCLGVLAVIFIRSFAEI